jgi:L,D-transpeptidase ErfK/SrfK
METLPAAAALPAPVSALPRPALPHGRGRWLRPLLSGFLSVLTLALVTTAGFALYGGAYRSEGFPAFATVRPAPDAKAVQKAEQRIRAARPRGPYIVVDTYQNRLRVFVDGEMKRDAICSTGSGVVLRDPRDGRQWVFDTPVGERTVHRKVKDPIWAKPDWAFIEEGYAPPKAGSNDRFDDFSLGKYGLYMGDGYIIHGTVFQTLLGKRVTHGCIRLGDADLEWVYKNVPLGAKVYLY